MFKDYLLAPVRPELHAACREHIVHRHSQLVLANPAFQGVFHRYAQYPVLGEAEAPARLYLYPPRRDYPLITEHACTDGALFRAALQDDRHKEEVKKDEEHIVATFLDGACLCLDMAESEVFAHAPVGRFHVFDFLARRADVSEQAFHAALAREAELVARDADYRAVVQRRAHNRVRHDDALYAAEGDTGAVTDRAIDLVVDSWTDSLDGLARFLPAMRDRLGPVVDPEASFSIIATEHLLVDGGVVVGRVEIKEAV